MIETFAQALPHGITLSCRAAGEPGCPVLVFLHGFPEAAFVWDPLLEAFAARGYRCVAPNLRGYEGSSRPEETSAYRARHLVEDLAALLEAQGAPVAMLVAHDWGGAVAWNLANQRPQLLERLAIVNSPHPGTFLRALRSSAAQQQASEYMNFLVREDAARLLAQDDYRRLFGFFTRWGAASWLTEEMKRKYREVWATSLEAGCNYYRASPVRPPTAADPAASAVQLAREALLIPVPTLVLWGLQDAALLPELLEGLEDYVRDLTVERLADASHWIIHERPEWVEERLVNFLGRGADGGLNTPAPPPAAAS